MRNRINYTSGFVIVEMQQVIHAGYKELLMLIQGKKAHIYLMQSLTNIISNNLVLLYVMLMLETK